MTILNTKQRIVKRYLFTPKNSKPSCPKAENITIKVTNENNTMYNLKTLFKIPFSNTLFEKYNRIKNIRNDATLIYQKLVDLY